MIQVMALVWIWKKYMYMIYNLHNNFEYSSYCKLINVRLAISCQAISIFLSKFDSLKGNLEIQHKKKLETNYYGKYIVVKSVPNWIRANLYYIKFIDVITF